VGMEAPGNTPWVVVGPSKTEGSGMGFLGWAILGIGLMALVLLVMMLDLRGSVSPFNVGVFSGIVFLVVLGIYAWFHLRRRQLRRLEFGEEGVREVFALGERFRPFSGLEGVGERVGKDSLVGEYRAVVLRFRDGGSVQIKTGQPGFEKARELLTRLGHLNP